MSKSHELEALMTKATEMYEADIRYNGSAMNAPYYLIHGDAVVKAFLRSRNGGVVMEIVQPEQCLGSKTMKGDEEFSTK